MSKKNKKGIELSAAFLVVITLSVVTLIFGFVFLSRFISASKSIESAIDSSYETMINTYLKREIAIIVPKIVDIKKYKILYVGLKNTFNISTDFNISFEVYSPKTGDTIITPKSKVITIAPNERKILSFFLNQKNINKINTPIILIGLIKYQNSTNWLTYYTQSVKILPKNIR